MGTSPDTIAPADTGQGVQVLNDRLSYAVEHCVTYDNLPHGGRFSRTHSKDDEVVCPALPYLPWRLSPRS